MNYRQQLIKAVQGLEEAEQILFTSAVNLSMAGELEEQDKAFEVNDSYHFNLELLQSVEDINVKEIVSIIELIQEKAAYIININKITHLLQISTTTPIFFS